MEFLKKNALLINVLLAGILLFEILWQNNTLQLAVKQITCARKVNAEMLDRSLEASRRFMLKAQKTDGNFIYEYDYVRNRYSKDDNAVRQAGGFWGLVFNNEYTPSPEAAAQIKKAIRFYDINSKETADGRRYIVYPHTKTGETGAVAIYTVALIDLMRSEKDPAVKEEIRNRAEKYLQFLVSLRLSNGFFHGHYDLATGAGKGRSSVYPDIETLLAITKAVNYLGHGELKNMAIESSEAMYAAHFDESYTSRVKYYHWGTMVYFEMWQANWEGRKKYAQRILDMADYMINKHEILKRKGNTGATFEGIVCAREVARREHRWGTLMLLDQTINSGLYRLLGFQVDDSPDPLATGAVRGNMERPLIRIDMTQHQTHAFVLARKYIYR